MDFLRDIIGILTDTREGNGKEEGGAGEEGAEEEGAKEEGDEGRETRPDQCLKIRFT